jgi:rRNA maturation RNase YbeY
MKVQKNITIELIESHPQDLISLSSYRDMIYRIIVEEKIPVITLNVITVNDEYLRSLHQKFLKEDNYTDVMTFQLEDDGEKDSEIYISLDRACQNAKDFKVELKEEFARLIIHGLLHIKGYKDKNRLARREMQVLEDAFLAKYWKPYSDKHR